VEEISARQAAVGGSWAHHTINKDLDNLGVLKGVTTFNFHLHLPHYALTTKDSKSIHIFHILARQPIDLSRPHPFTAAGNQEFNLCI
jgi:hypothetical protein